MSVVSIEKDYDRLRLTLIAEFDAPVERVWELWADPRKLERWWGPPGYPATFEEHALDPGSRATYFMTGPEGEKYHGWWEIQAVDPPTSLELTDGFADDDGKPNDDMPTFTMRVQLSEQEGGTRMELRSSFASREDMERILEMGAAEGMEQAMGQMDALLA
jgi:uncharacterized protein YndB with AHSA1/START domain